MVEKRVGVEKDIRFKDIKQFSGNNLFFLSLAHVSTFRSLSNLVCASQFGERVALIASLRDFCTAAGGLDAEKERRDKFAEH